jgi:hypothetical protein
MMNDARCYKTFYIFSNKLECLPLASLSRLFLRLQARLEPTRMMNLGLMLSTYIHSNKLECFSLTSFFQPSLMFASKTGAY